MPTAPSSDDRLTVQESTIEYSTAYTDIIGDDDDLINMVAYCLYKKQKREFIIKHQLAFNDPRIRGYHDDLNSDRIATLRIAAKDRLRDYADTIQRAVREEEGDLIRKGVIVEELSALIIGKHRDVTDTIKRETAWWKAVIYAVVGGFALGLIIVVASRIGFMNPFEALPSRH